MSNRRLKDGTIICANTSLNQKPRMSKKYENFGIVKAMITKIIPKDNDNNVNKKGVEYEVIICSGARQGMLIRGATPLCSFGGNENYNEAVYSPKTQTLTGEDKGDKTPPENTNGSYVILGFLNGHYNSPIILGGWQQPNNEESGATEDDGTRLKGRFQNLRWSIDKEGKLIISYGDNQIVLDGPNNNIEITAANKVTINANGDDVEINSDGDTVINSDGDTKVNSSGQVAVTAVGNISFSGPNVDLGSVGAGQAGVLGNVLQGIVDAHTHPGDSGGTTGPPNQSIGSALSSKIKLE